MCHGMKRPMQLYENKFYNRIMTHLIFINRSVLAILMYFMLLSETKNPSMYNIADSLTVVICGAIEIKPIILFVLCSSISPIRFQWEIPHPHIIRRCYRRNIHVYIVELLNGCYYTNSFTGAIVNLSNRYEISVSQMTADISESILSQCMLYLRIVTKVTVWVPLMEHELLTLKAYPRSTPVFHAFRVANLQFSVQCLVDHCLFFSPLSSL